MARDDNRLVELALMVELFEAKPNKLFPDELTRLMRFLRYTRPVPCAECGKRRKHHWTMLAAFKAHSMGPLVLAKSDKVHPPLSPVCRNHLLAPEVLLPGV